MELISNKSNFIYFLLLFFPISLISGPLLPEIISFLFLIYFFSNFSNEKYKKIYSSKIILFLIFLYIYLLILSFYKINFLDVLKDQFFYFRFITFSLAIYFLLSKKKDIVNSLGYCFLILFFILIFDLFIQYIFGKNIFGFSVIESNRYSGLFGDELIMGSYLSRFFPFVIGLIYVNNSMKYKTTLILITCILVILGVFITGERTAFGFTILTIIFLCLKKDFRRIAIFLTISVIISLVIISNFDKSQKYRIFIEPFHQMSLLSSKILNKYSDVAETYEAKPAKKFNIFSAHHDSHYKTGINIFKDNLVFGVGPEQFREKCKLKKYSTGPDPCSTHPHNLLIQVMSETGIVGLLLYMIILIFLLFKIFRLMSCSRYNNIKDLEYFILLTFLINLWPLFPSGNLFNNWLSFILYFPLGFYLYLNHHKNENI